MIIFNIRINYFVCIIIIIIDLGCSKKRAPGLWMLRKTPPPPSPPGYKLPNCKTKNETENLLKCFSSRWESKYPGFSFSPQESRQKFQNMPQITPFQITLSFLVIRS